MACRWQWFKNWNSNIPWVDIPTIKHWNLLSRVYSAETSEMLRIVQTWTTIRPWSKDKCFFYEIKKQCQHCSADLFDKAAGNGCQSRSCLWICAYDFIDRDFHFFYILGYYPAYGGCWPSITTIFPGPVFWTSYSVSDWGHLPDYNNIVYRNCYGSKLIVMLYAVRNSIAFSEMTAVARSSVPCITSFDLVRNSACLWTRKYYLRCQQTPYAVADSRILMYSK